MKDLEIKVKTKKSDYVFIMYQNDAYQLPFVVADTLKELSQITGIGYYVLANSCYRGDLVLKKYKIEKVDIREPEDKFNYSEYKKYCSNNNISICNFNSLNQFKKYIYGEFSL